MRKFKLFIISLIIISFLISIYFFLNPAFSYLSSYLSKSEQVNANILVVEGWLPDYAIELAYSEFQQNGYELIITTGLKETPADYFGLFSNGYLIFSLKNRLSGINDGSKHLIEVDAFSDLGGEHSAHLNLYVNDSLIVDYFAGKYKRKYEINWEGSLSEIDSVMVQFTNDDYGDFGDQNLFIKEIIIDNKIKIPYKNNTVYNIGELGGNERIINHYYSEAESGRNLLISMGVDSSMIIAVTGERVKINRTLTSALAFRDWLEKSDPVIKGINIISSGNHSRRTWMTFNKVLNEKYKIGIISLPDEAMSISGKGKFLDTFREAMGIIYYWFILIPY